MDALERPLHEIVWNQWPELVARLGERREAFVDMASTAAQRFGLNDRAAAARYLNLCFAFGPGFEVKPEHEWALATLSDPRLTAASRIHQLVRQAVGVLERAQGEAARLRAVDEALLQEAQAQRRLAGDDPPVVAARACDLETLQIGVAAAVGRREYVRSGGAWQRQPVSAPTATCQVDLSRPIPDIVHVLAEAAPDQVTQLVVKQQQHASCSEHHPVLRWIDERGISRLSGHAALAASWPLRPRAAPLAQPVHLIEEPAPTVAVLEAESCGVRDVGAPLGPQRTRVAVYPSAQHLFRLHRASGARWEFGAAETAAAFTAAGACATRLERDGTPLPDAGWSHEFDEKLPQAVGAGLQRLLQAWRQSATSCTLRAGEDLLCGRADVSWGLREAHEGLGAAPALRVQADFALQVGLTIELRGEVALGSTRAQLRLQAGAAQALEFTTDTQASSAQLTQLLLTARTRARWPWAASYDPITTPDAALWSEAGPCSGALVLEAGLRPRLSGGSGWEFFVRVDMEPLLLPVATHDPVLGASRRTLALLPAMNLTDWSLA